MDAILDEIKTACWMRLYYLAIMLCLALPDICGALESADGKASEQEYRAWADKWLVHKFHGHLPAQDMYRLRCGVLHQGWMGHPALRYNRVAFSVPGLFDLNFFPSKSKPEILNLNASRFCKAVVESVEAWYQTEKTNPAVIANLPRLVHFRPNGLDPYFPGVPCIS
jgi:hypothetical protein